MTAAALDEQLSLRIAAGEAQSGCKLAVKFLRFVRCTKCSASYRSAVGCADCDSGLITLEEQLKVTGPAHTEPGTVLRIAGKRHESTREPTGDLYLNVVIIWPTAVNADEAVNVADEAKSPRPRANAHYPGTAWIVAASLVLLVASLAWLKIHDRLRSDFGAHCVDAEDCRSNQCLVEYDVPADNDAGAVSMLPISRSRVDAMCTKFCASDTDCPSTTRCGKVAGSTSLPGIIGHLSESVCVKSVPVRARFAP